MGGEYYIERAEMFRAWSMEETVGEKQKLELLTMAIRCLNSARAQTIGHKKRDRLEGMVEQYASEGGVEPNLHIYYSKPTLHDYKTGNLIRNATEAELKESIKAAEHDAGAGVIEVDQASCYVME